MASWKDGAAYAPITRPDGFATPIADPLSVAEERKQVTPGPVAPPARLDVPDGAPDLRRIGRITRQGRDPGTPFAVATATMTSIPRTPDGRRDPRAPFAVSTADVQPAPPPQPPPPPPHQRPLAKPEATPKGVTDRQKPLVWLIAGMCTVGVVLTNAAPILMVIAGLISVLRVPWTSKIGAIALGVGSTFVLVQLLFPYARPDVLFGLASLLLGAAFLIRAFAMKDDAEVY